MNNEARVQVNIGVQVDPSQDGAVIDSTLLKWCYVLSGLLTLETLATLFFLGWH
jgi:hypothetical protein